MSYVIRRLFRGSRVNRDRRDQVQARSIIAEATRRHNACCTTRHSPAIPLTACGCQCHDDVRRLIREGEAVVCSDCKGTGQTIRYVSDLHVSDAVCLECNGTGWVK